MDKQRYREHLREGFSGMKDALEEIEKISDPKEKRSKSKEQYTKWDMHLLAVVNPPIGVHYEEPCGLGEYEELLNRLKEMSEEGGIKNPNKKSLICQYCKRTPTNSLTFEDKSFCNQYCLSQWQLPCAECNNYRQGNNWQRTTQTDNKTFCSQACFNNHYAETCDKCQQKALGDTYYNDTANRTGILCSTCHRKKAAEEKKETEILLQGIKQRILDAYNTLQSEAEQEPSISFFEIFDLSLVMQSSSYQDSKDMEVNCKAFLCEQLKEKELANELETYVEQIKEKIKQIRESKLTNDNNNSKNIPEPSNSNGLDNDSYVNNNEDDTNNINGIERERERERERESKILFNNLNYN